MSPEEKQYLDARRLASTYEDEPCPPTVRNDDRKTEPMASPTAIDSWECEDCSLTFDEPKTECPNCGCEAFRHVG